MKKLKFQTGETLVEMLFSMLIISLGMLMLSGSIITAARVNDSASKTSENTNNSSSLEPAPSSFSTKTMPKLHNPGENKTITVIILNNNTEFYLYDD